jgi:HK97 family phage portal protein
MGITRRLFGRFGQRAAEPTASLARWGPGEVRRTPDRYDQLAREGYLGCVVAYRCIREIARGAATVPWLVYNGVRELDDHPLVDLLRRPNPAQSGADLIEALLVHHQIAGNAWAQAIGPDGGPPREIHALRPDRMSVVPGPGGLPAAHVLESDGRRASWPVDPLTGRGDILHFRDFHPFDDWYGLSPLRAAAVAIDQFNAATAHNLALLQNGARPSGALLFKTDPGADNLKRVERWLADRFQGARGAGRPFVLGGDVTWLDLGLSPRDMDFDTMLNTVSRHICGAFGVPHVLVLPGESTYANRADARLELWEQTILPLLDRLAQALTGWLGPRFPGQLRIVPDVDEVSALHPRRQVRWATVGRADFLTRDEKRAAVGYPPLADAQGGA